MGQQRPLFGLLYVFLQVIIQFMQQFNVKSESSIWFRDSNSQPLDYEYPSLNTIPGLQAFKFFLLTMAIWSNI